MSQQNGHHPNGSSSQIDRAIVAAGNRILLERDLPSDYRNDWTITLAQSQADTASSATQTISALLFRLGNEALALSIQVLQEITPSSPIHTLPHRSTDLFLGLVNIRGEILPCVSLTHLLGVESSIDPTYSRINLRRMIVMGAPEQRWVFPVDEVYRVHRFLERDLQTPPSVITQANQAYTQGIIDWKTEKVNYLNADLLLLTLNRRIL